MAGMFEYRACNVRQGRVTFVNGEWQGNIPLSEAAAMADPFPTCIEVRDYLQRAGPDGWELVAAIAQPKQEATVETLYLKRTL